MNSPGLASWLEHLGLSFLIGNRWIELLGLQKSLKGQGLSPGECHDSPLDFSQGDHSGLRVSPTTPAPHKGPRCRIAWQKWRIEAREYVYSKEPSS